ncbi:MAG: polysaccharide biosynthesis protein [Acidobacteria bacterium]|nr:polysaccharide biosynthesis protein [Acidobacteriota bacterium]
MLRNVGSNWVLLAVNVATTYVLTPFIIRTLGNDGYGTWTLIASICGYIGLFALGVPVACVRYLAQHLAKGDLGKVNATIGSCAGLYLGVGAIAVLAGASVMPLLHTFAIPEGLEAQASLSFGLMTIYVSAGFIGLLPEGIMLAHHDFVVRNAVRISVLLLRLGLSVLLLTLRPTLAVLALVQLACLSFDVSTTWYLIVKRYPGVRISVADFDWRMVRQIFSFSLYVLLLTAGARLAFETDAIVIGAFLDVSVIPFYVIANSLIVYLMELVVSIAAVVSPMATRLHAEGRMDELRTIFLKWSKVALSITIVAGLFLIVLGPRFVGWWIDPSYEQPAGRVLQILMASSFVFLPVRGVALPILIGIGKPQRPAIGFIASGLLNLGLSVALARPLGLAGVALGTAIPNGLFAAGVLAIACRELEIGAWTYFRYVVPKAALGGIPTLALLLWFRLGLGVQGLFGLAAAGAATVFLFALTWIFFVYRRDPLVDVSPHLARLLAWGRA